MPKAKKKNIPPWVRGRKKGQGKYFAMKVTDPETGDVFDSKGEYGRWLKLKVKWHEGEISDLRRQVELPLKVNGLLIATYKADFAYSEDDDRVVEDFKGMITPEFKLKQKLVWACHGIRLFLTRERLDVGNTLARMKAELDALECEE